jgi:archaeosine-15-forming tRNA-guanine transglycosylase
MAEIKVSELPVANTLSANDRVLVLANTSGSAVVKTITTSNFANNVAAKLIANTVPVSNTSNGTVGQIAYDNNAIYVCVANNIWGRSTLTLDW